MSLMQFQRVDFSVGGPLLLEHVDLSIEAGERVCIVGRNGMPPCSARKRTPSTEYRR